MTGRRCARPLAALVLGVLLSLGLAHGRGAEESLVAGTLIVKFAGDHPLAARMRAALEGGPFETRAIAGLLEPICASVGIPLVPVRPTSGGELVLTIARVQALERLAARVRGREGVAAVAAVPDPGDNPFTLRDRILVDFVPASGFARLLSGTAAPPAEAELRDLARSLLAGSAYVADPAVRAGGRLELVLDWDGVAAQVASALRRRADVEYVQVERMLRPWAP